MAVYHQFLTVRRPAGQDFEPAAEGCFVVLNENSVTLASADTKPEKVYGLLTDVAEEAGKACHLALPGFSGIVGVRVAADVTDGDPLALTVGGAVKPAENDGTIVAVALASGTSGKLVEARLVQPCKATGLSAVALTAATPVAVAAASTAAKKTTSTKN